jgi:hypothetical protein
MRSPWKIFPFLSVASLSGDVSRLMHWWTLPAILPRVIQLAPFLASLSSRCEWETALFFGKASLGYLRGCASCFRHFHPGFNLLLAQRNLFFELGCQNYQGIETRGRLSLRRQPPLFLHDSSRLFFGMGKTCLLKAM